MADPAVVIDPAVAHALAVVIGSETAHVPRAVVPKSAGRLGQAVEMIDYLGDLRSMSLLLISGGGLGGPLIFVVMYQCRLDLIIQAKARSGLWYYPAAVSV